MNSGPILEPISFPSFFFFSEERKMIREQKKMIRAERKKKGRGDREESGREPEKNATNFSSLREERNKKGMGVQEESGPGPEKKATSFSSFSEERKKKGTGDQEESEPEPEPEKKATSFPSFKEERKMESMGDHEESGTDPEKKATSFSSSREQRKNRGTGYTTAESFVEWAKEFLKLGKKLEAASAFTYAARRYRDTSTPDAISCFTQAVDLFIDIGKEKEAAICCKIIGELAGTERKFKQAMDYSERAADLFESEEECNETILAIMCKQMVAQFAAQLEQYPKAIGNFEVTARQSMNDILLKSAVPTMLLNAGLCQLCWGGVVAITNSLKRYQELDPSFSKTFEYEFLADVAASTDKKDVDEFADMMINRLRCDKSWMVSFLSAGKV
ncbi:alpha-soluble NSF attachment protein-like isoform X2 [Magnolia sinica]|uniref:alpha-soluble NSF attachment protein-like isoform X2 n=1 Tax=Magnolia sinica TaxID=86752 RepID=UPI0026593292|nr:alpha-soluble NSF attachment protein-like isoform X2 [Magnolia sinica]